MAKVSCPCEAEVVGILMCSGAANVGEIAHKAARELRSQGFGRVLCLAGIGGHVSGLVQSALGCDYIIAIDGCKVSCSRKTLEHAEIPIGAHFVVTEFGFEKSMEAEPTQEEVQRVVKGIQNTCKG